jgi:hypothetical protein
MVILDAQTIAFVAMQKGWQFVLGRYIIERQKNANFSGERC